MKPYFSADGWDHVAILRCERNECQVISRRGGLAWWSLVIEGMTLDEVTIAYTKHMEEHEETR